MSLLPPPPNIHQRYIRLLAMAERGTTHEAAVAAMKLASLKKRYDFSIVPADEATESAVDLFSSAAGVRPDKKNNRLLMVFDMADAAIGNFVKWVLSEAFKVEGVWRAATHGKATALYVGAKQKDLSCLRHIAEVVSDNFKTLWRRFSESTGADPNDEPGFHAGLYDGLMREPREAGHAVPSRNRRIKKSRRKAPAKDTGAQVRPHAYSIARELGAQIRLSVPLDRMTSMLENLLSLGSASPSHDF